MTNDVKLYLEQAFTPADYSVILLTCIYTTGALTLYSQMRGESNNNNNNNNNNKSVQDFLESKHGI